ncbi:MAG: 5-dehydro-4-deoxy-D-glucuronate isomerase [Bacteroidales bacterium]|nr:MAG: 5-dehydro-4-deoxy-D-glucuronate isomerase [Bacteroidales bacterium]
MALKYEVRYATHPADVKNYDTEKLRKEFLIDNLFNPDCITLVYSHYDRFIVGGAAPVNESLELGPVDPLKSEYFLERRELGLINVGGTGIVTADGEQFEIGFKESLYLGKGIKSVMLSTSRKEQPLFYLNSAPAHSSFPLKKVTREEAEIVEMGSPEGSNHRIINKLIVHSIVDTCQLQMGMTELKKGSIWNTMPPHVHDRRTEAYFYFEVPDKQAVCHFMGQPSETRHIWMKNNEAVLSPDWSIHAGAGTSNYSFIWGMAGENLDYGDMDTCTPDDLR